VSLLLRNFVMLLALAFSVLVLGRVLMSWIDPGGRSRLSALLIQATEPILGPVRRLLPSMGMLDLSPMIVLIILSFVLQALR
jgi:YggT family protein